MDLPFNLNINVNNDDESTQSLVDKCQAESRKFIYDRAGRKRRITIYINKLKELSVNGLSSQFYNTQKVSIESLLDEIKKYDDDLIHLYEENKIFELDETFFQREIEKQAEYHFNISLEISNLESLVLSNSPAGSGTNNEESSSNTNVVNNATLQAILSNTRSEIRTPVLNCPNFTGTEGDKFAFKNFLIQFRNLVDSRQNLSNASKLTYLRGYVTGFAFKIIQHLSVDDSNYDVAIDLLKKEFLDIQYIIDETFKKIISAQSKFDITYNETKLFVNEMRSLLFELKSLGYDFLVENSPGYLFVSHVIFSKLPLGLKRELTHKVGSNYPGINDIFEHYNELIKTLLLTSTLKRNNEQAAGRVEFKPKYPYQNKFQNSNQFKPKSSLQNFGTNAQHSNQNKFSTANSNRGSFDSKPCKLCFIVGHTLTRCPRYSCSDARIERCKELNLCTLCSSPKHQPSCCPARKNELSFPCTICNSKGHITALCTHAGQISKQTSANLCLNFNSETDKPFILPTFTFKIGRGKNTTQVRCLLDTGSQRSYITKDAVNKINCHAETLNPTKFDIRTFIGSDTRQLYETVLEVYLSNKKIELPLLIDPQMQLKFEVSEINTALSNIVNFGYKLADSGFSSNCDNTSFVLDGLIGTDIIQFLPRFEMVKCMRGAAFQVESGIIPIGNVHHFLYPNQIKPVVYKRAIENVCTDNHVVNNSTLVNFVLDPKPSYFDPLSHVLTESEVEHGLENMFKLESLGLLDSKTSSFDDIQINKFNSGIVFKNNRYFVDLPWQEDKINLVKSNYNIALAILDKVVKNLQQRNLLSAYDDVFKQQLSEGIIERVVINRAEFSNHIWIPHRPVVKMEAQVTTKVRPVFNCSLSVDNTPSLNQAAYAGVDLMTSLVRLLLHFRCDKYTLLSDVKQAFLQIKLKTDEDKNRFSFFWKEGENLIAYRYTTLVFGFCASPFILNYVLKLHANRYPNDACTQLLLNNFYVDNLIVTGNDVGALKNLYKKSNERMQEGGFDLRSWNSNSVELQNAMQTDDRFVTHESHEERVLGYRYDCTNDTMKLADFNINVEANTKREILSQISKVFDPLSLYLPVTIRGRILMQQIWKLENNWDDVVSDEIIKKWYPLSSDLNQLKLISIKRSAFNTDPNQPKSLLLFCDASKLSYGFVAYALSGKDSNLIFAKSKVAPTKERTLPSLELLSVFLALKCLPQILASFPCKFKYINIFGDAQIVLSWILGGSPKIKDIFVRNRVKDILAMKKEIEDEYKPKLSFNYVETTENPADLLTRGLTAKEFQSQLQRWLCGPPWICLAPEKWPKKPLKCLSEEAKAKTFTSNFVTNSNPIDDITPPILEIENFSSIHKLHRVTAFIFKFIFKTRKVDKDPHDAAKKYWLKRMQSECFEKEIKFIKETPHDKNNIPPIINQLDLFLDDLGIVRSKGRISRSLHYNFDVLNPIMLGRSHHLTKLLIMDFHLKCQHLGLQTTVNCLRTNGYWVARARQSVKNIISNCITCKKFNNFAFQYPRMTNIAKNRMNFVKPFEHTGVDYTGHLFIKDHNSGNNVKMYILIYTCMNIRAIHLDLIPDMTTSAFLLSFQRFSNLYGIPSHLYSDNAKSFTAGGNMLKTSLSSDNFSEHLRVNNIKHVQIPLYSAWIGSSWERLIRVVKNCMYKSIGRAKLTYFEMLTHLSNIQTMVNSRPLTYRSSDNDLETISPNSFLKLHANPNLILQYDVNESPYEYFPANRVQLNKTLARQEETFEHFRELWYDSYLLSLREQSRNLYQSQWTNRIKVGDIVLIKMIDKPRPFWLLGRILEIIIGYDDKIRSVKLKRADGEICHYSISHLYPLELSLTHSPNSNSNVRTDQKENLEENLEETLNGQSGVSNCPSNESRPARKAAIKCKQIMHDNMLEFA